jgi:hypothetical protein
VAQNGLSTNTVATRLDRFSTEDIDLHAKSFYKVLADSTQLKETYLGVCIEVHKQVHIAGIMRSSGGTRTEQINAQNRATRTDLPNRLPDFFQSD